MILDIIIAAIMLASMITGYKMGLIASLLKTVGWIIAIILGVFLHPILYAFLKLKLPVQQILAEQMKARLDYGISMENIDGIFPDLLKGGFEKLASQTTELWANGVANLILSILSLLLVTVIIKVLFNLIYGLVSSSNDDTVIGFTNSLLGMIFGFIKGFLIVSLFFCFLAPFSALASPKVSDLVKEQLETSRVAGEFYNNNLAMVVFKNFSNDTK